MVLAVESQVSEDVEGDDGVKASDSLADGNGREGLVLEVVNHIIDAQVGSVTPYVGGYLHLHLVLQVLFGLLQLLLILLEQLKHGGVVEDGREVHHAGDNVENDAPAVREIALLVCYDELLLKHEYDGEEKKSKESYP